MANYGMEIRKSSGVVTREYNDKQFLFWHLISIGFGQTGTQYFTIPDGFTNIKMTYFTPDPMEWMSIGGAELIVFASIPHIVTLDTVSKSITYSNRGTGFSGPTSVIIYTE